MTESLEAGVASRAIGRVGCPPGQEANVDEFYFWVAPGSLVEQTQIVRSPTRMGGEEFELYGVVEQVFRRSTTSTMHMELVAHDGNPIEDDLVLDREGVTYAKVRVVNAFPPKLAPPVEGSTVYQCTEHEAEHAYEMDTYSADRGVCLGLIRSGGNATAGQAFLDMDYLLGAQAGHLNVNGAAGSGTKSSFLTVAVYQTLAAVRARAERAVGSGRRPRAKAIVFNVKGFDLFWLDQFSDRFTDEDLATWQTMGVDKPGVFESVRYFAPERPERGGAPLAIDTDRPGVVSPYSWSLRDVIDYGLFELLFSEETRANENMVTLINWLQRRLSVRRTTSLTRRLTGDDDRTRTKITEGLRDGFNPNNDLRDGAPVLTFDELLEYIEERTQPASEREVTDESLRNMSNSTLQALWRRLLRVLNSPGLLRREELEGVPLKLVEAEEDVIVVDVQSIADLHLQRFAIAAVLRQLVDWRSGPNAARDETFLVVIDELNRYAPRNSSDAITRLFEFVASQMRSRGIILFGAQQQGSRVSEVVIENSQNRVLGRSGGQELADSIWRGFSEGDRKLALRLGPDEKVIVAPNFREALHVKVPRPPWAMRPEEATPDPPPALVGIAPSPQPAVTSKISQAARERAQALEP